MRIFVNNEFRYQDEGECNKGTELLAYTYEEISNDGHNQRTHNKWK